MATESKGGDVGDGVSVNMSQWSGVHATAAYNQKCYDEAESNPYELPAISSFNPTEPRLVEYDSPLRDVYSIYMCLKKAPRDFKIVKRNDIEYLNKSTEVGSPLNIETIVSNAYPDWTPQKRAALIGLFIKMFYKQHTVSTWPPLNYPENDMPELCKIKGFVDETPLDSTIRILGVITERQSYTNIRDTFNKLKSMSLMDATNIVNRIAMPEWAKKNTLMTDNRTFYFNTDSEAGRFLGPIMALTWEKYLYDTFLNASYYTEFSFDPFYGRPLMPMVYAKKVIKRDQQCFFILPSSINIESYRIHDTYYSMINPSPMEPLSPEANAARQQELYKPISTFQWIQVDDTLDGKVPENGACMYQGYRLTHLPHPRILIALANGVKNMSEHMRSLFPEFSTDESRKQWIESTLETWRRDIESIIDTHQRFIQQYLYNDVSTIINTIFTKVPRIDANIKRLAANTNTTDPNAMFGRVQNFQQQYVSVLQPLKAAGKFQEIQPRNQAKRWYGAAVESKDAYRAKLKSYIGQIQRLIGGPSNVSIAVDTILKLTRMPKPNTREIYAQFNAWRNTLTDAEKEKMLPGLLPKIIAVRPAGFFEGAVSYAQKIGKLIMDAQPAAPVTVATAVLDTTLATINSGVKALKEDISTALPDVDEKATILRELGSLPATYDKSSTDSVYRYLITLRDTLARAVNAYSVFIKRLKEPALSAAALPSQLRRSPATMNLTRLPGPGTLSSPVGNQDGGRRRHRKSHRTGKEMRRKSHKHQRGGAAMPLAYFQDGAQMRGTYTDSTGVGLGAATNSMARSAIQQTGGFVPSIMGPVVQNGMYLMPLASFMSYKMMKSSKGSSSAYHKGSSSAYHKGRRSTHRGGILTHKKRRSTRRS